jgi:hypothetical protein
MPQYQPIFTLPIDAFACQPAMALGVHQTQPPERALSNANSSSFLDCKVESPGSTTATHVVSTAITTMRCNVVNIKIGQSCAGWTEVKH